MVSIPKLGLVLSGMCLGLLVTTQAHATTVTYSGTFGSDDQVQLYAYSLTQASNVTFSTFSYGGGTVGSTTAPAGGFVPVISLFDSTGMVVASDGADGTCQGGMMADPTTSMCDDAYLNENLAAGSYTLAITEFQNVPVGPNISNGFLFQGQGDFTGGTCGASGGFYQDDIAPCVQRTDSFAVAAVTTPEPATLWLGAIPLVLFGLARRRKTVDRV